MTLTPAEIAAAALISLVFMGFVILMLHILNIHREEKDMKMGASKSTGSHRGPETEPE